MDQWLGRVRRVRARALRRPTDRIAHPRGVAGPGAYRRRPLGVVRSGRGGRRASLDATDWTAQWIAPVEADPLPAAGERPASVLRTRFSVPGDHQHARIYATAHGLYELFLDGERVGDQELTPGFTVYRIASCRCRPTTWRRSSVRASTSCAPSCPTAGTGARSGSRANTTSTARSSRCSRRWRSTARVVVGNRRDLDQRAERDRRRRPDRRRSTSTNASTTTRSSGGPVEVVDGDFSVLVRVACPSGAPGRASSGLAKCDASSRRGRHVVDLGQNINGWVRHRRSRSGGHRARS